MEDFPFQRVYDHFAKPLADRGKLQAETLDPFFAVVRVNEQSELEVTKLDEAERFFEGPGGTAALGDFIRMVVPAMGDQPVCLLLISEAYYLETRIKDAPADYKKGDLKSNPKSTECVTIRLYRPERVAFGVLPIRAGRLIEYAPLWPKDGKQGGNLALDPDGHK